MKCPEGHESVSTDYCDVCGIAMGPAPADSPTPADVPASGADAGGAGGAACPSCGTANLPDALFCENCGYDFTTGSMPRPLDPPTGTTSIPADDSADGPTPGSGGGSTDAGAPATATPDTGTAGTVTPDPNSSAGLDGWVAEVWIDPDWYADQASTDPLPSPGLPLVVPLRNTSILIGRVSRSRNIHPDIDLSSDNGISRRHAQLTTDGSRWWVEDLGSSNGTYVGPSTGPIPKAPIPQGQKTEIGPDDRVYLGAWSRIILRRAAPGEI